MSETTGIQWTDATWNPWHGCHKISAGCDNCYMFAEKRRYGQDPDLPVRSKTTFRDPLKWKEPRLIFTCSWSDFFIAEADQWRPEAYAIMRLTLWHTYQVLTKRIGRALNLLPPGGLANMLLGVSVENRAAKQRISQLRDADVALRFLSIEPLLEDLGEIDLRGIGWVIVGGESGHGARPMHAGWARSIRDQCTAAGVPFFFKQWGEHDSGLVKIGKKKAGRSLDGRAWYEMPILSPHLRAPIPAKDPADPPICGDLLGSEQGA